MHGDGRHENSIGIQVPEMREGCGGYGKAAAPDLPHEPEQDPHRDQQANGAHRTAHDAEQFDRQARHHEPAHRGTGPDTEVEQPGKDGHGHGGLVRLDRADDLRLEGHVERRGAAAPQDENRARGGEARRACAQREQRQDHASDGARDKRLATTVVHVGEQDTSHQAGAAENRERRGDGGGLHPTHARQERLDVAIARVVGRGEQDRHRIHGRKAAISHERRQLAEGEGLARRYLRQDESKVDGHERRNRPNDAERHAPSQGEADRAPQRHAEDHGDGRSRRDHAERNRRMPRTHQARRHDRGDGPENRVGAGDHDARDHQNRERGGAGREGLTHRKHRENAQEQALELDARRRDHERQGEKHHRPRVHRDHDAGGGLGDAEARSDIGQEADGHELRGIEHERRERQARKRHPLSRCHAGLFARSAGVVRSDSPARAPHIHTPLRIDPQKRLAPHDTGPAEQPIDYRGPTVDPRT